MAALLAMGLLMGLSILIEKEFFPDVTFENTYLSFFLVQTILLPVF